MLKVSLVLMLALGSPALSFADPALPPCEGTWKLWANGYEFRMVLVETGHDPEATAIRYLGGYMEQTASPNGYWSALTAVTGICWGYTLRVLRPIGNDHIQVFDLYPNNQFERSGDFYNDFPTKLWQARATYLGR